MKCCQFNISVLNEIEDIDVDSDKTRSMRNQRRLLRKNLVGLYSLSMSIISYSWRRRHNECITCVRCSSLKTGAIELKP